LLVLLHFPIVKLNGLGIGFPAALLLVVVRNLLDPQ
jgi:hypothetical protein